MLPRIFPQAYLGKMAIREVLLPLGLCVLYYRSPCTLLVGSLKMNTALEYSTRVVQEGDRRCKKSTLNDLAYMTLLRIPLMNPVYVFFMSEKTEKGNGLQSNEIDRR